MGYFYAGGKTNQRVNVYAKMGETNQKYLSSRIGKIRNEEKSFNVFKYLEIPNSTQAVTRAIEGHVRLMLEREGYKNVKNDHFAWRTEIGQIKNEYQIFAEKAMFYAKQYCNLTGINYIEHEGKKKRKSKQKVSRCAKMLLEW